MAGVLPTHERGPMTYQVSAAIAGGQLVVKSGANASTIAVAGAAAPNILGVCGDDAAPVPAGTPPSYGSGALATPLNVAALWPWVRVYRNCEMRVVYSANADFGDLLQSAANGQVAPLGAGAPNLIVGRCTEPGGVTGGAGTVGRAWIAPF